MASEAGDGGLTLVKWAAMYDVLLLLCVQGCPPNSNPEVHSA